MSDNPIPIEVRSRIDRVDIQFVRYAEPRELLLKWLNMDPECPVESVDDVQIGSTDGDGNDAEQFGGEDFLSAITENGFWGYAMQSTREVHYWADASTPDDVLAMLLGHECGHLMGEAKEKPEDDEDMADGYGLAAVATLRELRRIQESRRPKVETHDFTPRQRQRISDAIKRGRALDAAASTGEGEGRDGE